MTRVREEVQQAIAALEAQRASLGDAVVDAAIAALDRATPPSAPAGERKLVTMLLADIAGFTALVERRDPEVVRDLVNACFDHLVPIIERHGGAIDQFIGDAVMALFGAPVAHENDPERAVRAALELRAGLAAFNAAHDTDLGLHCGLNTGLVITGGLGSAGREQYSVIGDAVNLAARLEELSAPGEILVGPETYRQTTALFEYEALAPAAVKGKADPVSIYRVLAARPRAALWGPGTRGVAGIATHLIGRAAELAQLQAAGRVLLAGGPAQVVTITGDAGIGKSRLLHEFEHWLADQLPAVAGFQSRANPELRHQPYALIRDLLAGRFQIQDSDAAPVVRARLAAGLGAEAAAVIAPWLGFDCGLPPPGGLDQAQQLRDRAWPALRAFFQTTAVQAPVVILLEDLHWADASSLDVIDHLVRALASAHVLLIGVARPTLFEQRPQWGAGWPHHTRLTLTPLSPADSRQLLADILHKAGAVPATLCELVVDKAEGNPFYLEELVKMLIEDDVIVAGPDRWVVESARLTSVCIPATLTGLLQARLDSLPAAERTTLQQAAAVGRTFWASSVAYLSAAIAGASESAATPTMVAAALAALGDREMVFERQTSAFAGTREYIFKHAMLRDVTYESILRRVRRVYHTLVAEWLIGQSGERASEVIGLIADHLELAGETARAAGYLRQAGEQAARQFAHAEAVAYLSRALALTAETDLAARYDLLLARERVYDMQGAREEQTQDLAALQALAEALADDIRRATVALRRANHAYVTGDHASAGAAAQEALRLAPQAPDLTAAGHLAWGQTLWRQGEYAAARVQLEQALAQAALAAPDAAAADSWRRIEAQSRRNLGNVCWYQGDYAGARQHYQHSRQISQKIGDRRDQAGALNNLGLVALSQRDYAAAQAYYQEALDIYRDIGDRHSEAVAVGGLGDIALYQGDYATAWACHEAARRSHAQGGTRTGEGIALGNLGLICQHQGDYGAARRYYEQALALCRAIGFPRGENWWLAYLALLAHHEGDDEAALAYGEQALQMAQDRGDQPLCGYAWLHRAHALAALSRWPAAADAYGQALTIRQELDQPHLAVEARAGLARVALARGDLAVAVAQVVEIQRYLDDHPLDGTEEPGRVYWTCYQVWQAVQDPRAPALLEAAYHLLQERSARIGDAGLRRSFLQRVAIHRAIIDEWQEQHK